MKLLTVALTIYLLAFSSMLNAGPCRDQTTNRMIREMGPIGTAATCPEWEYTRREEWNARRDVPRIPMMEAEYRIRLRSTERR